MDLTVAGIAILLIILAVFLRYKVNPGLLGIALVQVTGLGVTLAQLVTHWTTLETSLGAVARIKSFSEDTPSELLLGEDEVPDVNWPARGHFTFEGVSASYGYDYSYSMSSIRVLTVLWQVRLHASAQQYQLLCLTWPKNRNMWQKWQVRFFFPVEIVAH